jgi:membrane protease YdiL (CAAX protease family)
MRELQPVLALATIFVVILLIKIERGCFKKYGFQVPEKTGRNFLFSISLTFFYVTIITFLPGIFGTFEVYPPYYPSEILENTFIILLNAALSEIVFRGYIQTSLMTVLRYSYANVITSAMFTAYVLSASLPGSSHLILAASSIFLESIFLGALFKKTKTLLCPVIYNAGITILTAITPIKPIANKDITLAISAILHILFILTLHSSLDRQEKDKDNVEIENTPPKLNL